MACLLLPGDIFGAGATDWEGERLPVQVLTACRLADAGPIKQIIRLRSPLHIGLVRACEAAGRLEQQYVLSQLQRLTAPDAFVRIADFLLEVHGRLTQVGLTTNDAFRLPISQAMLANIVGLSAVHLNRVLRQLRCDNIIDARRGMVQILDLAGLRAIAQPLAGSFSSAAGHLQTR